MFNSPRPACFLSTPHQDARSRPASELYGRCRAAACARLIEHLDDAPAIKRAIALIQSLDAHQRAVADAGRRARLRVCAARECGFSALGPNFPRCPIRVGVASNSPSVSRPVISATTVGGRAWRLHRGFSARVLATVPSSASSRRMLLQLDAVGILQAELAGDFPRADLARIRADEGDDGVPARKTIVVFSLHLLPGPCPRSSSQASWVTVGFFFADVLAAEATGARALLTASDVGFAAAFFAASLLGRFWRVRDRQLSSRAWHRRSIRPQPSSAAAFLAPRFGLPPPLAARSSISSNGLGERDRRRGSCRSGIVALTPPAVT